MREWNAKVRVLAERQAGRVAWWQLVALGVDDSAISRWATTGYFHQEFPRVYAVGHRAPSVEADLWAAVLYAGPGAMLSHGTALWWHGLIDRRPWATAGEYAAPVPVAARDPGVRPARLPADPAKPAAYLDH